MPPAVATTQRLRTRVMPTSPTFCAYAVYGKVLKTPPRTVERPSARSPSASGRGSTLRPVISPTAIRSPVVSVIVTTATTSIDAIAETSKEGAPKWNGVLTPSQSASPTPPKSVKPNGTATARPAAMPTRTAIRLRNTGAKRCTPSTTSRTKPASARFFGSPKSSAPWPPAAQLPATGIRETPMIRMTVPVTSGGKNRSSFPKTGASRMIASPATITEP